MPAMSALQDLLDGFREASATNREHGTYFEELTVSYFRNEPAYKELYREVVPYSVWAERNGLDKRDSGIDLVAETVDHEYHAVQCKLYASDYRLQKADIDSFFTASGKKPFTRRVSSARRATAHAESGADRRSPLTRISPRATRSNIREGDALVQQNENGERGDAGDLTTGVAAEPEHQDTRILSLSSELLDSHPEQRSALNGTLHPGERSDAAAGRESATAGQREIVFISYRVTPDQAVAAALKRLIESSIDPAPEAFVAGQSGLRPSRIGYKPQLQQAAQRARAFIGIITPASREREWLFYEAGAAWGRNQIYAPLLVGTSPGDLPSTIADYQAIHANSRDQMEALVAAIAEAVGGTTRSRFAQRYTAFSRALENFGAASTVSTDDSLGATGDPLARAIERAVTGQQTEATEAFQRLEEAETDVDKRSHIRTCSIIFGRMSRSQRLIAFDQMPAEYRTGRARYWMALDESCLETKIAHLSAVVSQFDALDYFTRAAHRDLAKAHAALGNEPAALEILLRGLRSENREFRDETAEAWLQDRSADPPLVRLIVALAGAAARRGHNLFREAAEAAASLDWPAVRLSLTEARAREAESGASVNDVGRCYESMDLHSLAYEKYMAAAGLGASVAKCNAAQTLALRPSAAAAHALLTTHAGDFDSLSPSYPHQVRHSIERQLQDERDRGAAALAAGDRATAILLTFAVKAFASSSGHLAECYSYEEERYRLLRNGAQVELAMERANESLTVVSAEPLGPLPVYQILSSKGTLDGVARVDSDGTFVTLLFVDMDRASPTVAVRRYRPA